ncbi:uncharacterized protein LOC142984461 [Anticarsia gemmatalis]|uniref:uncharacterized protein LOC142984461 n=1 Tax=Anticarsia gemmatalis TaxID=129554 RepID=UPI003F75BEC5
MNNTENTYCRLCAESKPQNKLTDLQTDVVKRHEIVNNLGHLNIQLDFNENSLPKTVCLPCISTLQRAHDFVIAVERAQVVLNEQILTKPIKKEESESENENITYEPPDGIYDEDIGIKVETEVENNIIYETTSIKNKKLVKKKEKRDISGLDTIPISQLKLTWKDYSWVCASCETEFPTVSELISHSMEYHKYCNVFRCTDCNIRTLRFDKFVKHVRRHRKYLKLSCCYCFKKFQTPQETYKHIATHITSNFTCTGCNVCFSNTEELDKHTSMFISKLQTRNIPSPSLKNGLTCLLCKKEYKTVTSLNTHLLIHTDRKRDHTCEVCGKCFLNKQTLAGHILCHSNIKPFTCEICKFSFRTKNQLAVHVSVHNGEKPFSCEQCGKRFRLQRQLNSHHIVHTDSLPHVCSYCNKGFRFKTLLLQHIRQHTGVKPYSCDICQRDFANWSNYNKHMKRRHSMDMAKKKHTPEGTYPIDPETGKVVYPEPDKVLEWKKSILQSNKRGRRKQKDVDVKKTKSEESNNN